MRIVVVGSSGAGKTTVACQLAAQFNIPCIELDRLFWEPDWCEADPAVFRQRVTQATSVPDWVVDGNYSKVRSGLWQAADCVVWLDYPLAVCLWRVVVRSTGRVLQGEKNWQHSAETWARLFSRRSIVWWTLTRFYARRREYSAIADAKIVRLRSRAETRQWMRKAVPSLRRIRGLQN